MKPHLPKQDIADILSIKQNGESKRRQAAPEYSQLSYLSMIENERPIGNYLSKKSICKTLQIETIDRESMIALMQELHRIKKYHIETLFLASSIADRFLVKLVEKRFSAPNLV